MLSNPMEIVTRLLTTQNQHLFDLIGHQISCDLYHSIINPTENKRFSIYIIFFTTVFS